MKLKIHAADVARAISKKLDMYKQAGEILLDKKEELLDKIITYDVDNSKANMYIDGTYVDSNSWHNVTYITNGINTSSTDNMGSLKLVAKFGDNPTKEELVQSYKSVVGQLIFIKQESSTLAAIFRNCLEIDGAVEIDTEELSRYGL